MTEPKNKQDLLAEAFGNKQTRALSETLGALRSELATKQEVGEIRALLQELLRRMDALSVGAVPSPASASLSVSPASPGASPLPTEPTISDDVSEEVVPIIAATVAALWGKKARVRHIRNYAPAGTSSAWAQQGRVVVQGSHNLNKPRPSH